MHPSSEKGTMAKKNNITVKIIMSLSLTEKPLRKLRKPLGSEDLKKEIAPKIHQSIRTDMQCPVKSSVASAEDHLREDTTTLHTAKATMPGAVVVTWKTRNLVQ